MTRSQQAIPGLFVGQIDHRYDVVLDWNSTVDEPTLVIYDRQRQREAAAIVDAAA